MAENTDILDRAEKALAVADKPNKGAGPADYSLREDGTVGSAWVGEEFVPRQRLRKFMKRPSENFQPKKFAEAFKSFGGYIKHGMTAKTATAQADFSSRWDSVWKAVQGMSEGVGADGGFTVLPEFAPDIFDRVYANDLWERTDRFTVSGNRMTFPKSAETNRRDGERAGGIRSYWLAEGATIPGSNPTLAETVLKLNKLAVVVYLTNELLEDNAYALEQWVSKKVAEEINFRLGNAIINGTGNGMPLGILNSPALVTELRTTASTVVGKDILDVWNHRVPGQSTDNLVWLINQSVEPHLYAASLPQSAAAASPTLVYMPPQGLAERPYATIMGRPVIPTEFNPAVGTAGDLILADLSQYVTISKGGISEAVSMHVEFLTDQLALRFIVRVDGRPYDDNPITGFNTTDTYSPFVALGAAE